MSNIDQTIRALALAVIRLYQHLFSWDHQWRYVFGASRICRWYPSCSDYARTAFIKHSSPTALLFIIRRIARCHPASPGGVDDVPLT